MSIPRKGSLYRCNCECHNNGGEHERAPCCEECKICFLPIKFGKMKDHLRDDHGIDNELYRGGIKIA